MHRGEPLDRRHPRSMSRLVLGNRLAPPHDAEQVRRTGKAQLVANQLDELLVATPLLSICSRYPRGAARIDTSRLLSAGVVRRASASTSSRIPPPNEASRARGDLLPPRRASAPRRRLPLPAWAIAWKVGSAVRISRRSGSPAWIPVWM